MQGGRIMRYFFYLVIFTLVGCLNVPFIPMVDNENTSVETILVETQS